jgi:MFS family permease
VKWAALVPDVTPLRGPGEAGVGFRAVFTSRTVAYLGSQGAEVALLVQAQRITGSPLVVGTLGLAELVPLVVFGLYGGVLADRFDRRALMRWCEPGLAACALLLLLNALLPHPLLWPLYVVAALMMALASLQRPAFEAATPRIVPRDQLTAAAAIMSLSTNASVLVGSSLGGVLAASPGPWLVYALDAAGFAVSFTMLSRLPKLPPAVEESAEVAGGPALRQILVGLRYAVSRRDLLGSYLADLAAMIFAYPNAMLPFLAAQLHAPWSTGLMFAAPSAGAFAVSATSGWMPRVRRHGLAIALAAAGWGAAMAVVGLAPDVYVALACLAVAGGADECSAVFRDTMWKQSIPDHLRAGWPGSSCFPTRPGRPPASSAPARSRPSRASASPWRPVASPASPRWPSSPRRCPPSAATRHRRAHRSGNPRPRPVAAAPPGASQHRLALRSTAWRFALDAVIRSRRVGWRGGLSALGTGP